MRALLLILICSSLSALATDVAFWKPYETDKETLVLEHFDESTTEGRFGGGYQGPAAQLLPEPQLLFSGRVSLEAWVKLTALPEKRVYVIRRQPTAGTTRGFGLFIEPGGNLGMEVINCLGTRTELASNKGQVTTGEWMHLAGISSSQEFQVLYLNGKELKRQTLAAGQGLSADRQKESVAAPIIVGDGLPGAMDEVRIHLNVLKLWPRPVQPWLASRVPLPPMGQVVDAGTKALHYLSLEDGEVEDGVRGKAWRGPLSVTGELPGATGGAIEFWVRPVGINNYSDQNQVILHNSFFNLYLFNTPGMFRPLTLYYVDAERHVHFAGDTLGTGIYSGRWYHVVCTWGGERVVWYLDGQLAGSTDARFATNELTSITFNGRTLFGDIDEVVVYDRMLSDTEAANTYWRYVDQSKLRQPFRRLVDLKFWHLPSTRELHVKIRPAVDIAGRPTVLQLRDSAGTMVFRAPVDAADQLERFVLPELAGGDYSLNVRVGEEESEPVTLHRQRFAWEGNSLGITDKVYPPFEPVSIDGNHVSVVLREHTMNQFGLWDQVVAQDHELLAAPMRLVALDGNGQELAWKGTVKPATSDSFEAAATCPALAVKTTSTMEQDGMMRISMKLLPVADSAPLSYLSLEIPLRDNEAPLLHEFSDRIRAAYSGAVPEGNGVVWTSLESLRSANWLNAFTGYIWLGGPERGIAWFAENDRGWKTAKTMAAPLMRIIREGDRLTLKIDLVNVPGKITEASELVFGIQASPTRPLPADYRTKVLTLGGVGLPVHPWGGLSCSWKSPWQDRWEVVDKVIEGRNTGKVDRPWFEAFQKTYDVPPVHGIKDWVGDVTMFASRGSPVTSPDPVYFEEMAVLPFIPEYYVYQDEWRRNESAEKTKASVDIYRETEGREINPNARINYSRSYQDYTLSLINEWFKRGVSMYWDNTYLRTSTNLWTSAAYETEDGRMQPATTLWNQRQYMQRTWNLMNVWRERGVVRPLEFVAHMTNANLLPLFSWSTCNYDIEMSQTMYANAFPDAYEAGEPYTPEFLLAESTGRQVGAYPYIVHQVFSGQSQLPAEALGPAPQDIEVTRREWGMRFVHEIIRGGPRSGSLPSGTYDKAVYAFGYGSPEVKVWNYWDDAAAFYVDREEVKGLLLSRAGDGKLLLVLQSWSKTPLTASVELRPDRLGFEPGPHLYDAFANVHRQLTDNRFAADLALPYETAIFVIDREALPEKMLFADDFDHGLNPGWDYISSYAEVQSGVLRLGANKTSWQGVPRLFKWLSMPDFSDATLTVKFRLEHVPAGKTEVMNVRLPGSGVDWSKYGLTHSYLTAGGLDVQVIAEPGKGWRLRATSRTDGKWLRLGETLVGQLDGAVHRLSLMVRSDGAGTVSLDDAAVLEVTDIPVTTGNGFGISATRDPDKAFGALLLEEVTLTAQQADFTRLEAERQAARVRAAEIVAADVNPLKQRINQIFGWRAGRGLYALAMFRNPERDAAELIQHFQSSDREGERRVYLELLAALPERERDHVESMKAIGQPAERTPQFKAARAAALAFLHQQTNSKDLADAIQQTIDALSAGKD